MTTTTHRVPHNGDGYSEALDYNRLPEPWREWAGIAWTFAHFAHLDNHQDEQDLMHNIIVRCADVAEKYHRQGKSLSQGGAIMVAKHTRLRFYHQKKRWKRVSSVSLNSTIQDEDGYETEMIQLILDENGIDLDAWIDFKRYYQSRPPKERKAIRKMVKNNWRNLSGHDCKQIRRFRADAKIALA